MREGHRRFYEDEGGYFAGGFCRKGHDLSQVGIDLVGSANRRRCRECRQASLRRRKAESLGISDEELQLALETKVCQLCGRRLAGRLLPPGHFFKSGSQTGRRIDHDHKTGKFRGVLCNGCNTAIGLLGDDPVLILKTSLYVGKFVGISKVSNDDLAAMLRHLRGGQ
jgi:hypothetical protein